MTGWTGPTGGSILGAIDFPCRSLSLRSAAGHCAMKSAYRKFAAGDCQPDTAHDRHSVYRNISNGVYEQEYARMGHIPRPDFRSFCRVLTASSPTGEVPPRPPSEGVAPPASPLLKPPTTSSAKLLSSYPGADRLGPTSPQPSPQPRSKRPRGRELQHRCGKQVR